ncbi:hypothetical protein C882_4483 [Caenispirillum salinarum AK4]|uniref:Uncharacterized protein n=1 Tax=Caenispirillum salinarum AK4 TaxID=1238182 RepID=K9H0E0_9PROT|nr:hypothetical protein C882_4483 [Caenispirillum salinarum AK4]
MTAMAALISTWIQASIPLSAVDARDRVRRRRRPSWKTPPAAGAGAASFLRRKTAVAAIRTPRR